MNFLKTRKKLIAALTLGVLIVILILLPSQEQPSTTESLQTQIDIPAFNPKINPQPKAELPQELEIKTVAVFEPLKFDLAQIRSFFEPMATNQGFADLPEEIQIDTAPQLFWKEPPNFLTVNLDTSSFALDLHRVASSSSQISETDALLFAKNWLINHKLVADEVTNEVSYSQIDEPGQASILLFSFFPSLNGLPIFTTDSFDAPITVTVDKYGNIITVYYRLPALFFAKQQALTSSQKPVLNSKQVSEQIEAKNPVITAVNFGDGRFAPSTANLNELVYQKITLGYSNDFSLGFFLPVFQLQGTAKLDGGETVNVTAYLPALAE